MQRDMAQIPRRLSKFGFSTISFSQIQFSPLFSNFGRQVGLKWLNWMGKKTQAYRVTEVPQILFVEIYTCVVLILENCFHFCLCVEMIMVSVRDIFHKSVCFPITCVRFAYICLYTKCMQCLQRPKEDIRIFETWVLRLLWVTICECWL